MGESLPPFSGKIGLSQKVINFSMKNNLFKPPPLQTFWLGVPPQKGGLIFLNTFLIFFS